MCLLFSANRTWNTLGMAVSVLTNAWRVVCSLPNELQSTISNKFLAIFSSWATDFDPPRINSDKDLQKRNEIINSLLTSIAPDLHSLQYETIGSQPNADLFVRNFVLSATRASETPWNYQLISMATLFLLLHQDSIVHPHVVALFLANTLSDVPTIRSFAGKIFVIFFIN